MSSPAATSAETNTGRELVDVVGLSTDQSPPRVVVVPQLLQLDVPHWFDEVADDRSDRAPGGNSSLTVAHRSAVTQGEGEDGATAVLGAISSIWVR